MAVIFSSAFASYRTCPNASALEQQVFKNGNEKISWVCPTGWGCNFLSNPVNPRNLYLYSVLLVSNTAGSDEPYATIDCFYNSNGEYVAHTSLQSFRSNLKPYNGAYWSVEILEGFVSARCANHTPEECSFVPTK
jgi:hypothetical protein